MLFWLHRASHGGSPVVMCIYLSLHLLAPGPHTVACGLARVSRNVRIESMLQMYSIGDYDRPTDRPGCPRCPRDTWPVPSSVADTTSLACMRRVGSLAIRPPGHDPDLCVRRPFLGISIHPSIPASHDEDRTAIIGTVRLPCGVPDNIVAYTARCAIGVRGDRHASCRILSYGIISYHTHYAAKS